jgi:hypothetical protein
MLHTILLPPVELRGYGKHHWGLYDNAWFNLGLEGLRLRACHLESSTSRVQQVFQPGATSTADSAPVAITQSKA